MDRIFIILICLCLGGAGGYFFFKSDFGSRAVIVVQEPKVVNKWQVSESRTVNSLIVMKERKIGGKIPNNAVLVSQWESVARVGVDFTTFDWKELDGIGASVEDGHVVVRGKIPDLKVLSFDIRDETVENIVASKILGFDEDKLLKRANDRRTEISDCARDLALYRQDVVDNAMETIIGNISAAVPVDAAGQPLVSFELSFSNETDLTAGIEKLADTSVKDCGGIEIVN